jgi:hypothetical protein
MKPLLIETGVVSNLPQVCCKLQIMGFYTGFDSWSHLISSWSGYSADVTVIHSAATECHLILPYFFPLRWDLSTF